MTKAPSSPAKPVRRQSVPRGKARMKGTGELESLRRRLAEAEDALRAIREGEVDAVIVSGSKGERSFLAQRVREPLPADGRDDVRGRFGRYARGDHPLRQQLFRKDGPEASGARRGKVASAIRRSRQPSASEPAAGQGQERTIGSTDRPGVGRRFHTRPCLGQLARSARRSHDMPGRSRPLPARNLQGGDPASPGTASGPGRERGRPQESPGVGPYRELDLGDPEKAGPSFRRDVAHLRGWLGGIRTGHVGVRRQDSSTPATGSGSGPSSGPAQSKDRARPWNSGSFARTVPSGWSGRKSAS